MLMRTRVGRCGEFANVFTLFLRAMGLRAQYSMSFIRFPNTCATSQNAVQFGIEKIMCGMP